jgi:hypothetical protein
LVGLESQISGSSKTASGVAKQLSLETNSGGRDTTILREVVWIMAGRGKIRDESADNVPQSEEWLVSPRCSGLIRPDIGN